MFSFKVGIYKGVTEGFLFFPYTLCGIAGIAAARTALRGSTAIAPRSLENHSFAQHPCSLQPALDPKVRGAAKQH
jgi:hypothetical protein